ncbi:hypothetical protein [Virgibacillus pantothenticus]|uniref:hypothetical protein n=1 Tax=Virgibacillus pantothenticus TaxID=1473 RepID=UPI001BB069D2|nr:hypothetical protein [Virgibacillus pantothenticus]
MIRSIRYVAKWALAPLFCCKKAVLVEHCMRKRVLEVKGNLGKKGSFPGACCLDGDLIFGVL